MEARMCIGIAAALGAFACAFALALVVAANLQSRRSAMAAQGEQFGLGSLAAWRLRNGYTGVSPLVRWMLRWRPVKRFAGEAAEACLRRGCLASEESVLSVVVVGAAALALLVGAAMGNAVGAVACVACLVAVLATAMGAERDKRNEAVRDGVPEALESMNACFSTGFTLLQTFKQVEREIDGPLGDVFGRCAHVLETGGSAEQALAELRQGAYASELAFVAVALDVQHQSGGTIRQVLAAATDAAKGTLALRRSLRVQTAQAKLSARVVVVMPFILIAVFSLVSPDFLSPFFSSALGYALLGAAVAMEAAGIVLVRRALSVEGVA